MTGLFLVLDKKKRPRLYFEPRPLYRSNSQLPLSVISILKGVKYTRKLILVYVDFKTLFTVIPSVMLHAVLIGKRRPQDVDAELIFPHVFTSLRCELRENRDD